MKVFHFSTCRFDTLRPSKSQGKEQLSWVCSIWKTAWAKLHVEKRHGMKPKYLYVLTIPNSKLTKRFPDVFTIDEPTKVQERRKL